MRLNTRSSVDLPQPDGPISAVTRFSGMSSAMSLTARKSPYQKSSPRAASFGACAVAPVVRWVAAKAGLASFMAGIASKEEGASVMRHPVARHDGARQEADQQYEHGEHEGARPGQRMPAVVGAHRVLED